MNIFDAETGENLGKIEDIKEVNISHSCIKEEEHNKHGDINWFKYRNDEYTMTFNTDESIDTEYLYKILGVDKANMPDSYDIQYIIIVQARKHKKRRINKK